MIKSAFLLLSLSALAFTGKTTVYTADNKASTVQWLAKKTTGQHSGNVLVKNGQLNFDGTTPLSGEFVLDMNSITVTDIKNPDDNKSLVDHLVGDDFFNAPKFPTATITIKSFEKIANAAKDQPNYKVTADLTIKGIKNEIQFPAVVNVKKGSATAKANITIDRTKWNITYKSKSILGGVADKFIYDDVLFTINLALKEQK